MTNTDRDSNTLMMGGTSSKTQRRVFFEQLMTATTEQQRQQHIMHHYQLLTDRLARRLQHSQDPHHAFSQCIAQRHDHYNRYCDIIPYDATRVTLHQPSCGPTTMDYINASWISFLPNNMKKHYIATQGPLPSTCGDFWRMVLENNVKVIVCLTPEIEQGRAKCAAYWPLQVDQVARFPLSSKRRRRRSMGHPFLYNNNNNATEDEPTWTIQVKHTQPPTMDQEAACMIRSLQVTCYRTTKDHHEEMASLHVHQLHYLGWADHGVPQQPHTLNALVQLANQFQPSIETPMVVHCSAGCGRTGTFCVVDTGLAWLNSDDDEQQPATATSELVDPIYQITDMFRQQRTTMVQTPAQYLFCYRAIWDQLEKQQQ